MPSPAHHREVLLVRGRELRRHADQPPPTPHRQRPLRGGGLVQHRLDRHLAPGGELMTCTILHIIFLSDFS